MDNITIPYHIIYSWPLWMNIVIPILCFVAFVALIFVLYHIEDPGLKKIRKKQNGQANLDRNEKGLPVAHPPDSHVPLLPTAPLLPTNKFPKTVLVPAEGPSMLQRVEEMDELVVPPARPSHGRRRTFSDSTVDVGSVKKSRSETQILLENFLFRRRKHSSSGSTAAPAPVNVLGVTRMPRWRRTRSHSTRDSTTDRTVEGGAPDEKGRDFTEQNYVTVS